MTSEEYNEGYQNGVDEMMAKVNAFLVNECQIEHPRGMNGLRDLLQQKKAEREATMEMMLERIHDEFEGLKVWLQKYQGAGPYVVSRKLKEIEHYLKEGR